MNQKSSIRGFHSSIGGEIIQIPVEAFPDFYSHVYLVLITDEQGNKLKVLIDTGSGYGNSNDHLEEGLIKASALCAEEVNLENLTHILITHGHIDHFGGLSYIRSRTNALVGVHELDRRILTNYEERLAVVGNRLRRFLTEAGISEERRKGLLDLYFISKSLFSSIKIDFTYEDIGMCLGPFEIIHVPGHCAGHVVIRLGDVLFSGDHILNGISPHQAPEHLTNSTGLGHYLASLEKLQPLAGQIHLILGGHYEPFNDLNTRIVDIQNLHYSRLVKVLELLETPRSIAQISKEVFSNVQGYHVLLAIEEAGALVEYLYQRGRLGIANYQELENNINSIPIHYYRLHDVQLNSNKEKTDVFL